MVLKEKEFMENMVISDHQFSWLCYIQSKVSIPLLESRKNCCCYILIIGLYDTSDR